MEVLCDVPAQLRCHECGELNLLFIDRNSLFMYRNRKGCASSLRLLCENCGWNLSFDISK